MALLDKAENSRRLCKVCGNGIMKGEKFWYTTYKTAYHGSMANINICAFCIKQMAKRISKKELILYKKQRIINRL